MHHRALLSLSTALLLAAGACTKPDTAASTPPTTEAPAAAPAGGHEGQHQHQHQHHFEGAVKAYHDVLKPLWHAPKDDARVTNTCAAAADLVAKAGAIEAEPAPAAASDKADAWKTHATALVTATKALETECAGQRAGFEASFEAMHNAFHALIELAGEKHD